MRALPRLSRLLTRFGAAQSGIAVVEFALILPVMLLVYLGTIEASALLTVDRKVQNVSGSVGDLVAQSDTEITLANLQDYVRVAGGIMTPFDASTVTQVVTEVFVAADGKTAKVMWSKGYKGQTADASLGYVLNSTHTLPGAILPAAMVEMARNQYVIIAEASYTYKPSFYGFGFPNDIPLYRKNFYLPRFGGSITLK